MPSNAAHYIHRKTVGGVLFDHGGVGDRVQQEAQSMEKVKQVRSVEVVEKRNTEKSCKAGRAGSIWQSCVAGVWFSGGGGEEGGSGNIRGIWMSCGKTWSLLDSTWEALKGLFLSGDVTRL